MNVATVPTETDRPSRLRALLHAPEVGIQEIAAYLDGLDHLGRITELAETTRDDQRALYTKAAGSAPLTLEHFLPPSAEPLAPVVHHGRNTLPLPRRHRFFRKTMSRPDDGTERAFGYNDSPSQELLGPGYFVLEPTAGNPEWEARGAWVVNYFHAPDGAVPEGWPRVRPNTEGLQRFVFHGTLDFMRRVSEHVSIGIAYRGERCLDHYFTLCREP